MAIYLPGVKDYIPQLEVFTPDYKFLSDVLQTRQDRYTSNYKQLNNLYGKVVYADLSRQNNKDARDQYANKLSPKLQQISGLDLSLQENVDAAEGLFRPFYDNDDIVKDLVHTKAFRDEQQLADYYHNSPVDEIRNKYWDIGVKGMQYQMEEFVNAPPDKALKMPLPRYVPKSNFIERAREALANFGGEGKPMSIKDFVFTEDGKWVIEMENGSLLTDQPYIKADGTMGSRNPAKEFILNTLLDDPIVKDAYWVKAYVEAKDWSKEHAQEYGGNEKKAMEAWANNVLGYTNKEASDKLAETEMNLKSTNESVMDWERYKKENGIIPNSSEDDEYRKKIAELEGLVFVQKKQTARLAVQNSPSINFDDLMQKAYNAVFAYDIDKDATMAAVQHSSVNASRTPRETKYGLNTQQAIYDAKLKELAHEYTIDEIRERGAEARATANYEHILEGGYFGKEEDFGWSLDYNMPTSKYQIDPETEQPTTVPTYIDNQKDFEVSVVDAIEAGKYRFVQDYYTEQASQNTPDNILSYTYTYKDKAGELQTKTINWSDAQEYFSKPENMDQLNQLYNTAALVVKNVKGDLPTALGKQNQKRWEGMIGKITGEQSIFNTGVEEFDKNLLVHYDQYINSDQGKKYIEQINKGYLPIVIDPRGIKKYMMGWDLQKGYPADRKYKGKKTLLSKEKYKEIFAQRAEKAGTGITGNQLNATAPIFFKYWEYPTHSEWGANTKRTVTDLDAHGNNFNKEKALADADEIYDSMIDNLEVAMSQSPADKFTMKSYYIGEPQPGDQGLSTYPGYQASYDHEYKGSRKPEQMRSEALLAEIKDHLFSPGTERMITWGRGAQGLEEGEEMEVKTDMDAEQFLRYVVSSTDKKFNKDNKGVGHPQMNLAYYETLAPKGAERYNEETGETEFYAGYVISADPPFMKTLGKNLDPAVPSTADDENWDQGTVTMWIPQEKDSSVMKASNQRPSVVATEMTTEKDGYTRDFYPGGGYQLYRQVENGRNVYYENIYGYVRNTETNKWEKQRLTSPRIIRISGVAIQKNMLDSYVARLDKRIGDLRTVNLDTLKAEEKEKGKK